MARNEAGDANKYGSGGYLEHRNGATSYPAVKRSGAFPAKPKAPKGHEAFLKALETSGGQISVEKRSNGRILTGTVRHSDKYTISLKVTSEKVWDGDDMVEQPNAQLGIRIIFKSDISEFSALGPTPEPLPTIDTAEGTLQ